MDDLVVAKEIIRKNFIVGLMNDMEESIRRFNIVLGVDYQGERGQQCMQQFFGPSNGHRRLQEESLMTESSGNVADEVRVKATNNKNSNPHPKVSTQSKYIPRIIYTRSADNYANIKFSICHPFNFKVVEGSPEYNVLAERNAFDMILYNYITLLYEEQKMLIDLFAIGKRG